jgi:hypothetical protein
MRRQGQVRFGTISSDRGKGALQFTRLADHNPQHRHLQETGLQVPAQPSEFSRTATGGQCAERHP